MSKTPDGIILSCKGLSLNKNEKSFFSLINPFGFILFSRNFKSLAQVKKLIHELKQVSKNPKVLIFIDQEGGRVQRFKNHEFTKFPPQRIFGKIYKNDKKKAKKLAYYNSRLLSYELKEIGIDANCSPVLDLYFDYGDKIIGDRSFSSDPKTVTSLGKEFCRGHKDSGVIPVIKHFPGHGRAKVDSHKFLPTISTKKKVLCKSDMLPFKELSDEIFIMVAHVIYKDIDEIVAPYSKKILKNILIKELGFKGLIISDDLSMSALSGSLSSRTKKCYNGGCDIVLYCSGLIDDMKKIYKNVKKIKKKKFEYFENYLLETKVKSIDIKKLKSKLNESGIIRNFN